jgi:phage/plasmid-like protein (TIGR03299 family)
MFSAREVPWHKLGKIVDTELTAKEAIIAGGMDWRCEEHPLYLRGQVEVDGIPVIGQSAPEHKAIVRATDNSILGIVKNSYHIIQNSECFDFMDDVIGSGQAVYHTAGSLRNGKVIFMTVKLPEDAKIGDDVVEKYILLTSSHDGSLSLQVRWTPVRVVCMNTLGAALSGRTNSMMKIRHTRNYGSKVQQAREVLKLTDHYYTVMETEFNRLLDAQFSTAQMRTFTEQLMPSEGKASTKTKNNRAKVLELFHTGRGQAAVANTRWAAFNAVTEYVDHYATTRKHGDTSESEARMNSAILGSGADLKQRALNLLKEEPKIQEAVLA